MRATSHGGILLAFPPLSALVTHPDLGMPQLFAAAHARGLPVRQLDLNAELAYRYLRRPDVLRALASELTPTGRACLTDIVRDLRASRDRLVERLHGLGVDATRSQDAERRVLWHLDSAETLLPRPWPLAPGASCPEPALQTAVDELAMALSTGPLARVTGVRLVELVHQDVIQPSDFSPEAVRAAVLRSSRLLDRFYAEAFDPHLDDAPRLVGLSIHATRQLVPALQLAARIKERSSHTTILAGGPWCVAARELVASQPEVLFCQVDGFVVDEGDAALVEVYQALGATGTLPPAPGLVRRGDAPRRPPLQRNRPRLDELPAPRFDTLPFDVYPTPMVPFRTLRGCYWGRCRFCYHIHPDDLERRPPVREHRMSSRLLDQLVQTLRRAEREHGVRAWTTADNATPPSHLLQIARALHSAGIDTEWQCLARFDPGFTPELCREIARAGCRELQLGLETSSEAGWLQLHKGIDHEVVAATLDACANAGIERTVFVLDYPSPRPNEFRETLEFVAAQGARISGFIPLRFELGRSSRAFAHPDALGLELGPGAERSLDVFDLPFVAPGWQELGEHRALWDEYAVRMAVAEAARSER